MEININMLDYKNCGVYLNAEKVEKTILTLEHKDGWVYINGFICPVCKTYHYNKELSLYVIKKIADEDEGYSEEEFLNIKKYICHKLGIEYKYGENLKGYGEENDF